MTATDVTVVNGSMGCFLRLLHPTNCKIVQCENYHYLMKNKTNGEELIHRNKISFRWR